MIAPKKRAVLAELDKLDKHPGGARPEDGWWLPYHVRYYFGSLHGAGLSLETTKTNLRELAKDGLADRRVQGRAAEYRINDAGRAALAEQTAHLELEIVNPASHHKGRRLKVYGTVVDESHDGGGYYAIIEQGESE